MKPPKTEVAITPDLIYHSIMQRRSRHKKIKKQQKTKVDIDLIYGFSLSDSFSDTLIQFREPIQKEIKAYIKRERRKKMKSFLDVAVKFCLLTALYGFIFYII